MSISKTDNEETNELRNTGNWRKRILRLHMKDNYQTMCLLFDTVDSWMEWMIEEGKWNMFSDMKTDGLPFPSKMEIHTVTENGSELYVVLGLTMPTSVEGEVSA